MLMNRRDFLVKGGVVVGTSLIPNTALAVFGSSVRGTMGAAGAAGAGAAGDVTSYVFDGASRLVIPDHADFDFGSGGWTVEFWRYEDTVTNDLKYLSQWEDSSNDMRFQNKGGGNKGVQARIEIATSVTNILSNNSVLSDRTWHHVAFVHDGSDNYVFIDGVDQTLSHTHGATAMHDFTGDVEIGALDSVEDFVGYMDEIRVSDTARYTTGFTPTTTQFVSDANTKLLIHGGEAYTGPLTGETTQSCVALDGTGDYLSIPDHADWSFGGGDFTLETWVRFESFGGDISTFIQQGGEDSGTNLSFNFDYYGNTLRLRYSEDGVEDGGSTLVTAAWTPSLNIWYHVAISVSGDDLKFWADGVQVGSTEDFSGITLFSSTDALWVGAARSSGAAVNYELNGDLTQVRVSDTARYTSGFTPATERHTSDANTLLLIHGDENSGGTAAFTDSGNTGHTVTPTGNAFLGNGGTFTDSGNTGHTVIENGQAQRETAQEFKFADDGVGYFLDGTGDWLGIPDHADWDLFGDLTIEFWLYLPANNAADQYIFSHWVDTSNFQSLKLESGVGFKYRCTIGGSVLVNTSIGNVLSIHKWQHVAFVRENDDYEIYVNGIATSPSNTPDSDNPTALAGSVFIGQKGNNTNYLQAYIDEYRVSDIARYSTGFTPSSTQFSSDANTLLLIHGGEAKSGTTGSGATFTDSGNTGHTVTENGNAIEATGNFYKF